jgi:hypothetical protein
MRLRLSALIVLALTMSLLIAPPTSAQPASRCSMDSRYPLGAVFALENTPHLWLFTGTGASVRWVGDTRALASVNFPVRWDATCLMDVTFLANVKKDDPVLSAGLVKIGDPIYLAKWEQGEASPTLLHIQSIADVEAFGINAANYTRFVMGRAEWEQRYGFNADIRKKGELAAVGVPVARPAAPTPIPAPPRPTATPASQFPIQDPPPDDVIFYCLRANPSCARDHWWVEWNELQRSDLLSYRPTPGLVFESRFIEAIGLIWQWAEGKELIRDAAADQVFIVAVPEDVLPTSFAAYVPSLQGIGVSRRFTETSTWMISDVLAHELKHASDARQGLFQSRSADACIAREQRAYQVENRFVRWIAGRMGGLPSASQVASRLTFEDFQLFLNVQTIANSSDPAALATQDYRGHCATRSSQVDPGDWPSVRQSSNPQGAASSQLWAEANN